MISRLLVVCVCLQLSSLVDSSLNVSGNNVNNNINNVKGTTETKILENNNNGIIDEREDLKDNARIRQTGIDDRSEFVDPWYTNVPMLPIAFATSTSLPDGPCKKQAQRYLRDLRNGTLWATQMYDSSTKYPDGVINGHTRHFGDFDGCYYLNSKIPIYDDVNDEYQEISGRYCLVEVQYEKKNYLSPIKTDGRYNLVFDPDGSVWEAIKEKNDFRRVKRYILQMALCVPEVCSASDIEAALKEPITTFGIEKNLNLNVSVKPQFCQALKDAPKFSRAAKVYCAILAGLIGLVIVSTCYDFTLSDYVDNVGAILAGLIGLVIVSTCYDFTLSDYIDNVGSKRKDLLLCFSARRNFNTLIERTSGHPGFETLHLVRFFYLTLTMIGHRAMAYYTGPVINVSYLEHMYEYKLSMLVFAGPHLVDGFFSFGGLLVTYSLLHELDAKKKMNFLGPIIIRYLRLTPSYTVVVFFAALILPYLGNGPYWEWKVGIERDSCSNNWWANILYINNYVNPDMMCLFQSWYLAIDFQLYVIALLVVYLFWQMPRKIGYLFLSSIIIGGCVTPFVLTYYYNAPPMFKGLLTVVEIRRDSYFNEHYIKTHKRITAYFIGVLFGAVVYDHGDGRWRMGKITSNILFILFAAVLSLGCQMLGHKYYDPNENPTLLEAGLYACLHRVAFAIAGCAIPGFITFGTGMNFHYNFLTPRWAQPLGRLTYGAFLIHTVIQLYDVGVTRSARTFRIYNMFWDFIPDVAFAFFLSFLLTLLVEGPFRRIEKRFIMKREKIEPSNNNVQKEVKKND